MTDNRETLRYQMVDPADEAGIVLCAEEDEEGITSWEVSFSGEIVYDNEEDAERARQEYALAIHQNLLARSPLPTQAEVEEAIANLLLARIESPPSDCDNYIAAALRILQRRVPADRRHGTPDQPAPVNRWARLEAGAKSLPLGVVFQGGGLHDTPQYDVADAALRYARGESGPLDRVAARAQHREPQPWTSCSAWTEGHSERAEQQAIADRDTEAASHPTPREAHEWTGERNALAVELERALGVSVCTSAEGRSLVNRAIAVLDSLADEPREAPLPAEIRELIEEVLRGFDKWDGHSKSSRAAIKLRALLAGDSAPVDGGGK